MAGRWRRGRGKASAQSVGHDGSPAAIYDRGLIGYSLRVMVTVLRESGFSVMIYKDDHRPEHVHVFKDGGEAKINLGGPGGRPEIVSTRGLKRPDIREAFRLVAEHRDALREHWRTIHG